jgi:hypothetical protein
LVWYNPASWFQQSSKPSSNAQTQAVTSNTQGISTSKDTGTGYNPATKVIETKTTSNGKTTVTTVPKQNVGGVWNVDIGGTPSPAKPDATAQKISADVTQFENKWKGVMNIADSPVLVDKYNNELLNLQRRISDYNTSLGTQSTFKPSGDILGGSSFVIPTGYKVGETSLSGTGTNLNVSTTLIPKPELQPVTPSPSIQVPNLFPSLPTVQSVYSKIYTRLYTPEGTAGSKLFYNFGTNLKTSGISDVQKSFTSYYNSPIYTGVLATYGVSKFAVGGAMEGIYNPVPLERIKSAVAFSLPSTQWASSELQVQGLERIPTSQGINYFKGTAQENVFVNSKGNIITYKGVAGMRTITQGGRIFETKSSVVIAGLEGKPNLIGIAGKPVTKELLDLGLGGKTLYSTPRELGNLAGGAYTFSLPTGESIGKMTTALQTPTKTYISEGYFKTKLLKGDFGNWDVTAFKYAPSNTLKINSKGLIFTSKIAGTPALNLGERLTTGIPFRQTSQQFSMLKPSSLRTSDLLTTSPSNVFTLSRTEIAGSLAGTRNVIGQALFSGTRTSYAPLTITSISSIKLSSAISQPSLREPITITKPAQISIPAVTQTSRIEPTLKPINIHFPVQVPTAIQVPTTIQTPVTIQQPVSIQTPVVPTIFKFPITPIVPAVFPLVPSFDFGMTARKFRGKQRKKYTPSFEALIFGIRGKAPKRITGLETRPITKGFSFAFKESPINLSIKPIKFKLPSKRKRRKR